METDYFQDALLKKKELLLIQISDLQSKLKDITNEMEISKLQLDHIETLLKLASVEPNAIDTKVVGGSDIANCVYDLLKSSRIKKPLHYIEITKNLQHKGVVIPGANPASNLLTNITRDERFERVRPGTYGLKEWNSPKQIGG